MYEFIFHEKNGVGMEIDSVLACNFVGEVPHAQYISRDELESYGLKNRLEPGGSWSLTGGMPVQEKLTGVGITLRGTDDAGQPRAFSSYIALSRMD